MLWILHPASETHTSVGKEEKKLGSDCLLEKISKLFSVCAHTHKYIYNMLNEQRLA